MMHRFILITSLALVPLSALSCASNSKELAQESLSGSEGQEMKKSLERAKLTDNNVRLAMSQVARDAFIPEEHREFSKEDRALPIGFGQTISQPFIVALMTQEAQISQGSKVLEIGTGSGYQAAVLSELGAQVYSIEIVPELAKKAKETLASQGYDSVILKQGDGFQGWADKGPFDAILVTAASPRVPPKLLEQLANRGRLIIPLERAGVNNEVLVSIEKRGEDLITKELGAVRFVPLTGEVRDAEDEFSYQLAETPINPAEVKEEMKDPLSLIKKSSK